MRILVQSSPSDLESDGPPVISMRANGRRISWCWNQNRNHHLEMNHGDKILNPSLSWGQIYLNLSFCFFETFSLCSILWKSEYMGCEESSGQNLQLYCNIPSCDMWKGLRELIWLPMSPKLTYLFRSTSWKNSRVKRAWTGVVEGWVTYREVIRDSVRVRPKHGKRSGGD